MSDAPIIPPNVVGLPPMDDDRPPRLDVARPPKSKRQRRHTADRFGTLNAFLDMTAGGLTRAELLTWLILYRDTKPDGTTRTAQADIGRRSGITSRSVRYALKQLKASGLVRIAWQGGLRKGASAYAVEALPKDPLPKTKSRQSQGGKSEPPP